MEIYSCRQVENSNLTQFERNISMLSFYSNSVNDNRLAEPFDISYRNDKKSHIEANALWCVFTRSN